MLQESVTAPSEDTPESAHELPGRTTMDASDAPGSGDRHQVIVLAPEKGGVPAWRRPLRLPAWAMVLVVLVVAFGVYQVAERGWFEFGGESAQASSEVQADGEAGVEGGGSPSRFRQVADSLEAALEGYRLRQTDFQSGRIGCTSLRAGYRAVDRHFVTLSVLMRDEGGRLGTAAEGRYGELTADVDEVNRHFDGTRCRAGT